MTQTPDQVLRRAAQHWMDRLLDGDATLDYPGFDDDLEAALKVRMVDVQPILEWLEEQMRQSVGVWKHFGDSAYPAFEACRNQLRDALESP